MLWSPSGASQALHSALAVALQALVCMVPAPHWAQGWQVLSALPPQLPEYWPETQARTEHCLQYVALSL
jgi:hypothetical protein